MYLLCMTPLCIFYSNIVIIHIYHATQKQQVTFRYNKHGNINYSEDLQIEKLQIVFIVGYNIFGPSWFACVKSYFVYLLQLLIGYFRLGQVRINDCPARLEPPTRDRNRRRAREKLSRQQTYQVQFLFCIEKKEVCYLYKQCHIVLGINISKVNTTILSYTTQN